MRRQRAIESYTGYFCGSMDENCKLLESLTIGEIYEEIKSERLFRQTGKQRQSDTKTSQGAADKHSSEGKNAAPSLSKRRQQAIESYTEYFGGSAAENEKQLAGFTVAQIYAAIDENRALNDTGRGNG